MLKKRGRNYNGAITVHQVLPAVMASPDYLTISRSGKISSNGPIATEGVVSYSQGLWRSKLRQARCDANLRGQPERLEEPQKTCAGHLSCLNHHYLLHQEHVDVDPGYTVMGSWTHQCVNLSIVGYSLQVSTYKGMTLYQCSAPNIVWLAVF